MFNFVELPQRFEYLICLLFIDQCQCEAYVNKNVISDASLRYVVQADFFADVREIYLATAQTKIFFFEDGYDSPGQSQTHGAPLAFDAPSENSLAKCTSDIVGLCLVLGF